MPLRSLRRALGDALGEVIFAAIFAAGLIVLATVTLNGFDLMATARFVDNFIARLLAASPDRLTGFAWIAGTGFAGLMALILLVRAMDRRRPKPPPFSQREDRMSETSRFPPPAVLTHPLDRMTRRLCVGLSAAAFAISALLGLKTFSAPEPPVFVSVSVKSLLEEQMLSGLGRDVTPQELERRSADYITALEAVLSRYSQDERVILIASEAVLGETVPDFTSEVRQEAYRLAGELAARRGQSLPALGDTSGADRLVRALTEETADMRAALDGPSGFTNPEAGQ